MTYEVKTKTEEETLNLATKLMTMKFKNMVICLDGDLGAGKTLFTKGIASSLHILEPITSPTFTIIKEYIGDMPLYHMDVYRINGITDGIGIEEYFTKNGIVVIEWSNTILDILPDDRLEIEIIVLENNERLFKIIPFGKDYEKLCEAVL